MQLQFATSERPARHMAINRPFWGDSIELTPEVRKDLDLEYFDRRHFVKLFTLPITAIALIICFLHPSFSELRPFVFFILLLRPS